jgi:hypothetical protein
MGEEYPAVRTVGELYFRDAMLVFCMMDVLYRWN